MVSTVNRTAEADKHGGPATQASRGSFVLELASAVTL